MSAAARSSGGAVTVGILYGSRLGSALVGVVTTVIVARVLGPDQRGAYFLAQTVALGAFSLAHLSLDQGTFWAVAERSARVRQLWRPLALWTGAATIAAVVGYAALVGSGVLLDGVSSATVIVAAVLIPASLVLQFSSGLVYAFGQARVAAFGVAVAAGIQLVGTVAFALAGRLDSTTAIAVVVVSTLLGTWPMLATLYATGRHDEPRLAKFRIRELLGVSIQNHLGVVSIWLARRADILVISFFVSAGDLGVYTLAVTLTEFVLLSADAVAQAALGRQGALERGDSGRLSVALAADSTRIALVQVIMLGALGWPILLLGFGREWLDAYPSILALSPGIVALAYVRPLLAIFIRTGHSLELSLAIAVAAGLKIGATGVFAEHFGPVAVAAASSVAWIVAAMLIMWRMRAALDLRLWAPSLVPGVLHRLRGT